MEKDFQDAVFDSDYIGNLKADHCFSFYLVKFIRENNKLKGYTVEWQNDFTYKKKTCEISPKSEKTTVKMPKYHVYIHDGMGFAGWSMDDIKKTVKEYGRIMG